MTINFEFVNVKPIVLPEYNSKQNVLKEIFFTISATDTDSGNSSHIARTYYLDIDREYTDDDPFIPFENFTTDQIDTILRKAILETGWAKLLEDRIHSFNNQPTVTSFSFQQ